MLIGLIGSLVLLLLLALISIRQTYAIRKQQVQLGLVLMVGKLMNEILDCRDSPELPLGLPQVSTRIREITGANFVFLGSLDRLGHRILPVSCSEPEKALGEHEKRIELCLNENKIDPFVLHDPALIRDTGRGSGLVVPLRKMEKVVGILFLESQNGRTLKKSDLPLAYCLAEFASLGMNILGLVQEGLQQKNSYNVLQKLGERDPKDVLEDLEVARAVQTRMLPSELPQLEGIILAAKFLPANEIGGDFYDAFLLRDQTLAMNIGDVSGKSISAALLVSMAKFIFRFPPSMYIQPSKLMELANKMVYVSCGGMFITDCFAILDLAKNQLVYVNAGHPPPLYYRSQTDEVTFLPSTGIVLGAAEEPRYREEVLTLSPGDMILFYTDGLTEVKMEDRKVFGEERLASVFKEMRGLPPSQLVQQLLDRISAMYQEGPRDDLACLLLKVG